MDNAPEEQYENNSDLDDPDADGDQPTFTCGHNGGRLVTHAPPKYILYNLGANALKFSDPAQKRAMLKPYALVRWRALTKPAVRIRIPGGRHPSRIGKT